MAYLTPAQIDDLVKLTTNKFYRGKWTDISLDTRHFVSGVLGFTSRSTEPSPSERLRTIAEGIERLRREYPGTLWATGDVHVCKQVVNRAAELLYLMKTRREGVPDE